MIPGSFWHHSGIIQGSSRHHFKFVLGDFRVIFRSKKSRSQNRRRMIGASCRSCLVLFPPSPLIKKRHFFMKYWPKKLLFRGISPSLLSAYAGGYINMPLGWCVCGGVVAILRISPPVICSRCASFVKGGLASLARAPRPAHTNLNFLKIIGAHPPEFLEYLDTKKRAKRSEPREN